MTPCSSLACSRPATHHSRRFGPETPYCRDDAAWADGVNPRDTKPWNAPVPIEDNRG